MHGAKKGLNELCGMLKTAESDIKKNTGGGHVMAVQNKPTFKKKGSSWKKKKKKGKAKVANPMPTLHPRRSLDQLQTRSAFIVTSQDTGKGTASCT